LHAIPFVSSLRNENPPVRTCDKNKSLKDKENKNIEKLRLIEI
jgi:hypothetical protein